MASLPCDPSSGVPDLDVLTADRGAVTPAWASSASALPASDPPVPTTVGDPP